MNIKTKKIIFQKCQFNNIYFLFYIIAYFINILIEHNLESDMSYFNSYILPIKILDNLYIYTISDFLALIPHFIRKKLVKNKNDNITNINIEDNNNNNNNNNNDLLLIYNDKKISVSNTKKKTILLYLLYVGIFDFLERFVLILYNIIYPDERMEFYVFSCLAPLENILQFICSYFLLKIRFHKLQYFSLFLNLGIFIIILIIDLINILEHNAFDGKIYFFYAVSFIFYSIEYSFGKKILIYGFVSMYLLIIIKGVIGLILVILFSLITLFVKIDIFSRIGFFFTEKKYIWLIIAKIFSDFFVTLFIWILIDRFSPNYLPFAILFNEVCKFILNLIYGLNIDDKTMGWDIYFRFFLYIISFIGVMIHNEIVVINICNLGSDTKYFLDIELEKEELLSKTNNPEIIQRYETLIDMESEDNNSKDNEGEN